MICVVHNHVTPIFRHISFSDQPINYQIIEPTCRLSKYSCIWIDMRSTLYGITRGSTQIAQTIEHQSRITFRCHHLQFLDFCFHLLEPNQMGCIDQSRVVLPTKLSLRYKFNNHMTSSTPIRRLVDVHIFSIRNLFR